MKKMTEKELWNMLRRINGALKISFWPLRCFLKISKSDIQLFTDAKYDIYKEIIRREQDK